MPQPLKKKKKRSRMRATNTTIATTDFMWNVLWIYSRRFELALQVLYSSGVRWLLRLAVVSHRDLTNKQSKLSAETCCRLEPAVCSSSSSQTGELQQAMRTRHGSNKHAQTHRQPGWLIHISTKSSHPHLSLSLVLPSGHLSKTRVDATTLLSNVCCVYPRMKSCCVSCLTLGFTFQSRAQRRQCHCAWMIRFKLCDMSCGVCYSAQKTHHSHRHFFKGLSSLSAYVVITD